MEKTTLGKLKDSAEFLLSKRGETSYIVQKKFKKKGKVWVVFTSVNSDRTFTRPASTKVFIDS